MSITEGIIIFFYGSLILELTIWHIPSVVSNVNILQKGDSLTPKPTQRLQSLFNRQKWQQFLLLFVPLLFIYAAYLYPILQVFISRQIGEPLTSATLAAMIGLGLILLGRVVSLIYIFTIRKNNQQYGDSFQLKTAGIFQFSRNPGLMGLYISFLGFFLRFPSVFFAICLVIYFFHMHFKVLLEEDFLSSKFGLDYKVYLEKTKRYL